MLIAKNEKEIPASLTLTNLEKPWEFLRINPPNHMGWKNYMFESGYFGRAHWKSWSIGYFQADRYVEFVRTEENKVVKMEDVVYQMD